MNSLVFEIERLEKGEVLDFCKQIRGEFPYMLAEVELNEYSEKLSQKAEHVTCRNGECEIIGMISFYMNNGKFGYITLAAIKKGFQKKHLFSKMLYLLEAKARVQECAELSLEVARCNANARSVYANSGFVLQAERDNSVIMNKTVCNQTFTRGG